MWKKLLDSEDVITYEKDMGQLKVRIEARRNHEDAWEVYVSYYDENKVAYTEEFCFKDREQAQEMMLYLQERKLLTLKQIRQKQYEQTKNLSVDLKRTFKEYNFEKWDFALNGADFCNFAIVRFAEITEVDLVVNERYKDLERKIIDKLSAKLGLESADMGIQHNIYYYNNSTIYSSEGKLDPKGIELGFGLEEEE